MHHEHRVHLAIDVTAGADEHHAALGDADAEREGGRRLGGLWATPGDVGEGDSRARAGGAAKSRGATSANRMRCMAESSRIDNAEKSAKVPHNLLCHNEGIIEDQSNHVKHSAPDSAEHRNNSRLPRRAMPLPRRPVDVIPRCPEWRRLRIVMWR
jgi:hypothetical protein